MTIKKPKRGPVPQDALDYFEAKELEPAFDYAEVWREEHDLNFTVAKVMELDILADVQDSLTKAIEEGQSFRKWAKGVDATLDKSGWSALGGDRTKPHRLRTIYDTNMRQARAVGQWQRVEKTTDSHPYLQYNLGPSERHRPEHEALEGTILRADDDFWDSWMPINGWSCKCYVTQVTERRLEREGGLSETPEIEMVDFVEPKTGKKGRVPKGIDPGFDHNPGKERKEKLDELLKEREDK